jgi:hypothetical protein
LTSRILHLVTHFIELAAKIYNAFVGIYLT